MALNIVDFVNNAARSHVEVSITQFDITHGNT